MNLNRKQLTINSSEIMNISGCPKCGCRYWGILEIYTTHTSHSYENGIIGHNNDSSSGNYTGEVEFSCNGCNFTKTYNIYSKSAPKHIIHKIKLIHKNELNQ